MDTLKILLIISIIIFIIILYKIVMLNISTYDDCNNMFGRGQVNGLQRGSTYYDRINKRLIESNNTNNNWGSPAYNYKDWNNSNNWNLDGFGKIRERPRRTSLKGMLTF